MLFERVALQASVLRPKLPDSLHIFTSVLLLPCVLQFSSMLQGRCSVASRVAIKMCWDQQRINAAQQAELSQALQELAFSKQQRQQLEAQLKQQHESSSAKITGLEEELALQKAAAQAQEQELAFSKQQRQQLQAKLKQQHDSSSAKIACLEQELARQQAAAQAQEQEHHQRLSAVQDQCAQLGGQLHLTQEQVAHAQVSLQQQAAQADAVQQENYLLRSVNHLSLQQVAQVQVSLQAQAAQTNAVQQRNQLLLIAYHLSLQQWAAAEERATQAAETAATAVAESGAWQLQVYQFQLFIEQLEAEKARVHACADGLLTAGIELLQELLSDRHSRARIRAYVSGRAQDGSPASFICGLILQAADDADCPPPMFSRPTWEPQQQSAAATPGAPQPRTPGHSEDGSGAARSSESSSSGSTPSPGRPEVPPSL
jgi:hypothetical protein